MIDGLNNYYVFYNVAKYGNISKAASNLYISQPAISKAISKLEKELNTMLFIRSPRGVKLTEEGQVLFEYVEKAFENILKGEENIKKYNELGIGHLRIGVSTSLCKHILLDYLKDFIKDNPHIKVSIDCHSTLNTIALLNKEEIDIGLICETDLPHDIVYNPIKEIHDIFVASPDYIENFYSMDMDDDDLDLPSNISGSILGNFVPFLNEDIETTYDSKKKSSTRTTKDLLSKSNLMILEEPNVTRTHVDRYLKENDIICSQLLEINNMDLLIDFATIGMGIASVVREFSSDALASGKIKELPLDTEIPKRTVGFAYSDTKRQTIALKKFLDYIK